MEMLIKLFMSIVAIIVGGIIGAPLGWQIGKLFRKNKEEEN